MSDTTSRKWQITINNPQEKGYSHEVIRKRIELLKGTVYWCLCDEVGNKEHTYHTHIYLYRPSPIRFSKLKKTFEGAHFEMARGTSQENRDYIRKEGKYVNSNKTETNLKDTFEEFGECPQEQQGARNDLTALYDMIKDGMDTYQILEENPNYMKELDKIDKCRELFRYEEYRKKLREIHVEYWFGKSGTGKTSGIYERYGYENVYRITDYKNPFDGYHGQDVIVFEEFHGDVDISKLLIWLDRYPLELPCRYNNKTACYTKVYFTSNKPLDVQYMYIQREEPETWQALLRRIHCVKEFSENGIVDYLNIEEYLQRFRPLPEGSYNPFRR